MTVKILIKRKVRDTAIAEVEKMLVQARINAFLKMDISHRKHLVTATIQTKFLWFPCGEAKQTGTYTEKIKPG